MRLVRFAVGAVVALLVLALLPLTASASTPPYQWIGSQFANFPQTTPSQVMTWEQGTISIPAPPTWTANGQEVSGWFMGSAFSNYHQVGWVSYQGKPQLYEETGANGASYNDSYFATLSWNSSINVALSCDLETGIWQDWWQPPGTTGWTLLDTQWTLVPCDSSTWSWQFERYSAGASTFPSVGPMSITNVFADVTGAEYYPAPVYTGTAWQ